jgi:hypothetical protein
MGKSVESGSAQKSVQGRDYWGIDATRMVAKSRPRTAAFHGLIRYCRSGPWLVSYPQQTGAPPGICDTQPSNSNRFGYARVRRERRPAVRRRMLSLPGGENSVAIRADGGETGSLGQRET